MVTSLNRLKNWEWVTVTSLNRSKRSSFLGRLHYHMDHVEVCSISQDKPVARKTKQKWGKVLASPALTSTITFDTSLRLHSSHFFSLHITDRSELARTYHLRLYNQLHRGHYFRMTFCLLNILKRNHW